jgi:hypothetical protein
LAARTSLTDTHLNNDFNTENDIMDINTLYPSRYLSADDLQGQPRRVTIQALTQEMVGMGSDARMKPVLSFAGKQKMLVVNKTNALAIASQHGNDTTAWVGRDIILKPVMVGFQGKQVLAVRVDTFTPLEPRRGEPTPPVSLPPPPPEDDIPW